jgi:hypothetical protein
MPVITTLTILFLALIDMLYSNVSTTLTTFFPIKECSLLEGSKCPFVQDLSSSNESVTVSVILKIHCKIINTILTVEKIRTLLLKHFSYLRFICRGIQRHYVYYKRRDMSQIGC